MASLLAGIDRKDVCIYMDIVQNFYDNMAEHYHKLFLDWQAESQSQAEFLGKLFADNGYDKSAKILDCACGIGTQAIGLSTLGYDVSASDISEAELTQARKRAQEYKVSISFKQADFRGLGKAFFEKFNIVIAMDNALPHMLTKDDLASAVESIVSRIEDGGMFVASIRDYDALLMTKPSYSPPYIHKTDKGRRVSFQTWDWEGNCYDLTQYIVEDEESLSVNKFSCRYRATTREELSNLLFEKGCSKVTWLLPEESGFYQPVVVAKK